MRKYEQRKKVRKWLNRYRFIVKEIAAREKHLQEFIQDIYNPLMSTQYSDMPKGKGTASDQTYNTVAKIEKQYADMMIDMQNAIDDLVMAKGEIDKAINSLDEYERCVCYHRFVLGIYWADLPAYISYEVSQCYRLELQALDKLSPLVNKKR